MNNTNSTTLRLLPRSISHTTNHSLAKNGCCDVPGSSHRAKVLQPNKDNWFYSLKEHRVSIDSWNLLKCVAQSDFQCIRCKTFFGTLAHIISSLGETSSLDISWSATLKISTRSIKHAALLLFLSEVSKFVAKWSIWLIDNWST